MKEIKTFEELFKIQDDKASFAIRNDLLFTRRGYLIIDGYVLMIGADCKESLELFYVSHDTYNSFTQGAKEYIERWYGVK